jgi:hypothetical protein
MRKVPQGIELVVFFRGRVGTIWGRAGRAGWRHKEICPQRPTAYTIVRSVNARGLVARFLVALREYERERDRNYCDAAVSAWNCDDRCVRDFHRRGNRFRRIPVTLATPRSPTRSWSTSR